MSLFIASDHGGYSLKQYLIKHFVDTGVQFEDLGPYEMNEGDDYPEYAFKLGERVSSVPGDLGILICKNAVGVCIAANKVKGIRAGISWNSHHAQSLKNDDNTNVLCLPAHYINNEEALEIVGTWLSTPFSDDERHKRRVEKISEYEKR